MDTIRDGPPVLEPEETGEESDGKEGPSKEGVESEPRPRITATEVSDLLKRVTLAGAILSFLAVYGFGWASGASPESTFLKGMVAMAVIGSLGWILTLVLYNSDEEKASEEKKGKNIDFTVE